MTLKVIGAGLGRTGTYSLKLALEELGFGPCHHMEEVLKDPMRQVPLWSAALQGKPDWEATFEGYNSAVDWPGAAFWQELADHYTEAKVILTVRSAESWSQSYSETISKLLSTRDQAPEHMRPWFDMALAVTAKSGVHGELDEAGLKKAFKDHEQAVRDAVPSNRLLIYQVMDGWQPLCKFLDRPIPDGAFPKSNNRSEFWDLVQQGMG